MSVPGSFEELYRDETIAHGAPAATPWDIGEAQPFVKQLVALGAIRGEVLDPGTGPGFNSIYLASQGLSATGIDGSAAAIERAKDNARAAGVSPSFRVVDATTLEGFEAAFDTVVDSAFFHVLAGDEDAQGRYLSALHRATRPGASLFLYAFGTHHINGVASPWGIPEEVFRRQLPAAGWEITYLGPTTYVGTVSVADLAQQVPDADASDAVSTLLEPLRAVRPFLSDGRVHFPFWEVHATRVD